MAQSLGWVSPSAYYTVEIVEGLYLYFYLCVCDCMGVSIYVLVFVRVCVCVGVSVCQSVITMPIEPQHQFSIFASFVALC